MIEKFQFKQKVSRQEISNCQQLSNNSSDKLLNDIINQQEEKQNFKSILDLILESTNIKFEYQLYEKFNCVNGKIKVIIEEKVIDVLPIYKLNSMYIQFNDCKITTLDYSEVTDMVHISQNILYGDNSIERIILPLSLEKLYLKQQYYKNGRKYSNISYIDFTCYQTIKSIEIEFYNVQMQLSIQDSIYNNSIDLTKFSSLKILKLGYVQNDIILPKYLIVLELKQLFQYQYKILNFPDKLNYAKITNFKLQNIDTSKFAQLSLQNCYLANIIIHDIEKYWKILCENQVKNIYISCECLEFSYFDQTINNLIFQDCNTESIKIQEVSNIFTLTKEDCILEFLDIDNYKNTIDLSTYSQLKEFEVFQLTRQVIFPLQIQKIHIKHIQYEINILDFSQLLLLQKLEINNLPVQFVIIPKFKKQNQKMVFSFNPQNENFIHIETHELDLYPTFAESLKFIKVRGLINVLQDKNSGQNTIDFSIFPKLQQLSIIRIDYKLKLPTSLVEINIKLSRQLQDFDFSQFILLEKITLTSCIIDNLITNIPVRIINCNINYLLTYSLENVILTQINIFEPVISQKHIVISDSCQITTLKIDKNEQIQSMQLHGIRKIIYEDKIFDENLFDLTHFKQLEKVILKDIICKSIVFGASLKEIKVQFSRKTRIKKLDLLACCVLRSAEFDNMHVQEVVISSPVVQFSHSLIKVLKISQVTNVEQQFVSQKGFYLDYKLICRLVVECGIYQQQKIIYKNKHRFKDNHRDVILSLRMQRIYENICKLIYE